MIAATSPASHTTPEVPRCWQDLMAAAITDPADLLSRLGLSDRLLPAARRAAQSFPLRVPLGFVARMRRGDERDPLLRQVLPLDAELEESAGYSADPVGDLVSRAVPGVLHKYEGRALLIATGACAVHCRYCFRRHFPYGEENASQGAWRSALHYLRSDVSIQEVLLSGGDPLSLSDRRLAELWEGLRSIPHLRRFRIHTRQPIVLPERVDAAFCRWLDEIRLQKVIVLHANHANEIDASVRDACDRLRACGATLLNQSVLLAGVNDSATDLAELSETLFAAGVMPYYLNLLDRVQGAAHFEVTETRALELHAELRARLPGYLVPRLVREVPGADSKLPVPQVP